MARLVRTFKHIGKRSHRYQFDVVVNSVDGLSNVDDDQTDQYYIAWSSGAKIAHTLPRKLLPNSKKVEFGDKLSLVTSLYLKKEGKLPSTSFESKDCRFALKRTSKKKKGGKTIYTCKVDLSAFVDLDDDGLTSAFNRFPLVYNSKSKSSLLPPSNLSVTITTRWLREVDPSDPDNVSLSSFQLTELDVVDSDQESAELSPSHLSPKSPISPNSPSSRTKEEVAARIQLQSEIDRNKRTIAFLNEQLVKAREAVGRLGLVEKENVQLKESVVKFGQQRHSRRSSVSISLEMSSLLEELNRTKADLEFWKNKGQRVTSPRQSADFRNELLDMEAKVLEIYEEKKTETERLNSQIASLKVALTEATGQAAEADDRANETSTTNLGERARLNDEVRRLASQLTLAMEESNTAWEQQTLQQQKNVALAGRLEECEKKINSLSSEKRELQREVEQLQVEKQLVETEAVNANSRVEILTQELKAMCVMTEDAEGDESSPNGKVERVKSVTKSGRFNLSSILNETSAKSDSQQQRYEAKLHQAEIDKTYLRQESLELEKNVKSLETKCEELECHLRQVKFDRDREVKHLQFKLSQVENHLEEALEDVKNQEQEVLQAEQELQRKEKTHDVQIASLSHRIKQLEDDLAKSQIEIRHAESQRDVVESQLDASNNSIAKESANGNNGKGGTAATASAMEMLQNRLDVSNNELQKVSQQLKDADVERDRLQRHVTRLELEQTKLDAERDDLSHNLRCAKSELSRVENRRLSIARPTSTAVASGFGEVSWKGSFGNDNVNGIGANGSSAVGEEGKATWIRLADVKDPTELIADVRFLESSLIEARLSLAQSEYENASVLKQLKEAKAQTNKMKMSTLDFSRVMTNLEVQLVEAKKRLEETEAEMQALLDAKDMVVEELNSTKAQMLV